MLSYTKQSVIQKINRPANGGSLKRAGKKEGVRGRNFCLPVVFPVEFAQTPIPRRPPPFGRRVEECVGAPACVAPFQRTLAQGSAKNLWKLASRTFKISPNLFIEAAPFGKSRFFRRGGRKIPNGAAFTTKLEPISKRSMEASLHRFFG